MNQEPLISVVIPVRNGAPFVASAMASVLGQNYGNLEVLLVDDGSTDGLSGRLEHYREFVRYIRQEQRGQAAARNHGIRESAGSLVAFLDIDDLWTHSHLSSLRRSLDETPQAGIAQGAMRQFWAAPGGKYKRSAPYRMPYLGSCLFRREVFRECGLFAESMPYGEDYDFIFRCWENDIIKVNVATLSLLYRRHPNNLSSGRNQAAHLLVLKRRIERIRAGVTNPVVARRQVFQDYIGDLGALSEASLEEVNECDLLSP